MTVKPIVLGKPDCPQCVQTKRAFEKVGVEFDYLDMTEDQSALEMAKGLGYRAAPVVIWGADHWSGFRPDLIGKILKAKS